MIPAADYARAAAYLDASRLPAYVSFVEQATARGIGRDDEAPQRIYVRTADGAIVSGAPPSGVHVLRSNSGDSENPFGKRRFFDPACYVAKTENETRWNGQSALRFQLQPICNNDNDNDVTELYADPLTLRPIAVDGTFTDTGDSNMTVALELRYTTIADYTLPSSIRAHAVGHGLLFWARERVEVDYTAYEFYRTFRKQTAKP